jgi:hypothetical protein
MLRRMQYIPMQCLQYLHNTMSVTHRGGSTLAYNSASLSYLQETGWDDIETSEWWHERGLKRPRSPSASALAAICQDVASGVNSAQYGIRVSYKFWHHDNNL